jgi:L-amino acid N-acyltransferase
MKNIVIRDATTADLPAINDIYNAEVATGTSTWDGEPWTLEEREAWLARHGDDTTPVIVAEVNGVVRGFAYLSWYRNKSGFRFTREDSIYIDPSCRGKGLGMPLLAALIQRAQAARLHVLVAVITADNEASIRLHQRLGFEESGRLRECGYKFGHWLDVVEMSKILE